VAGSNGKTSSKELIFRVLNKKYKTFATPGNYNNHIGVPLSLLSIPQDTEMAILEIGANHAQEHALLCQIISPTHGVITNNGKDHLEGFGSIEGVIKANAEVYDYFTTQNQGLVFVNADDSILLDLSKKLKRYTYGEHSSADIQGNIMPQLGPLAFTWHEKENKERYLVQSKMMGNYNLHNLLLATAVGRFFEVTPEAIAYALSEYAPANNRSQWLELEGQKIILDAYNANPSSVMSALESLFDQQYAQRLILLGDMAELGEHSSSEHLNILHYLEKHVKPKDKVILVGCNYAQHKNLFPFIFLNNREEAIKNIHNIKHEQYLWLVKGSRSMKMEEVVYGLFEEFKKG
jgi:UDP-N-acetylmuramoyl-tripeptide--D-alanyl-D-alanine ligase